MCISCGACVFASSGKIQLEENKSVGMYLPNIIQKLSNQELITIKNICPANGYKINSISKKLFDKKSEYDYRIGRYLNIVAVKSCSNKLLEKASSGSIMTALSMYLLDNKIVQGIAATIFTYNYDKVIPTTRIFTSSSDLLRTQGSKYMPVPALMVLDEIINFEGKVAFIGTPCQIAGLRLIQDNNPLLKEKIILTIGNFCGGFKDLRELNRLRTIAKMRKENIIHFQYRGDGQPGKMLFQSKSGKKWERSYTRYGGLTGYMKHYRCRVCIDATAELADISCGDAWLPRFLNNGGNWSVVIVRNPEIQEYLSRMESDSIIKLEKIGIEELVFSQKENLTSKKERYLSRNNFLKKTGHTLPVFDSGWNEKMNKSFFYEAKVYYAQLFKYYMEKIRLYSLLRLMVKTIIKD